MSRKRRHPQDHDLDIEQDLLKPIYDTYSNLRGHTQEERYRGGLTIPGYPHTGPGNTISDKAPSNTIDRASWQHDKEYSSTKHYVADSEADDKWRDSVKNATSIQDKIVGKVGTAVFNTKKAISPLDKIMAQKRTYADITPPPSGRNQGVARELQFGGAMDVDTPQNGQIAAQGATQTTDGGGGGGSGVAKSSSTGLEYIPGHMEDDLKPTMTMKTSNTFRAFYSQTMISNPALAAMKNGVQPTDQKSSGVQSPGDAARLLIVDTPWKYIPNNRLDLYCTPGQMSRFINAGYTGYRVKHCGFKLYGVYNMQNYKFSADVLQGADTAYTVIMEPKNKFYKNQTPVNHQFAADVNPNGTQPGFDYGDPLESDYWRQGTTASTNNLVQCKVNIPTSLIALPANDYQMKRLYMDATRHEAQVLVRNGQSYQWSWTNPDSRFINIYNHNFSSSQTDVDLDTYGPYDFTPLISQPNRNSFARNHRLRRNFPMQILDDSYKKNVEGFWADNQNVVKVADPNTQQTSWKNQALHYNGPGQNAMIPPVLIKIPDLKQNTGETMNHNVWMYIDYHIELEFVRGSHTQIFNAPDGVVNGGTSEEKFYGGIADYSKVAGYTQQAELTGEGYGVNYVSNFTRFNEAQSYSNADELTRTTLDRAIPAEQQVGAAYATAWDNTAYVPGFPTTLEKVEEDDEEFIE